MTSFAYSDSSANKAASKPQLTCCLQPTVVFITARSTAYKLMFSSAQFVISVTFLMLSLSLHLSLAHSLHTQVGDELCLEKVVDSKTGELRNPTAQTIQG